MPKRTNDFQSLIAFIYNRISPKGGKVTESEMVFDKEAKILREVDILVSQDVAGHEIRLAVECRDRSRAESVEWIDALIGKTQSLDVHKVVAVSSEGFSASAKEKATAHGIDTLTLEEANEKDWETYFIKPGIVVMSDEYYTLKKVFYYSEGGFEDTENLGLLSKIYQKEKHVGTIKEFLEKYFLDVLIKEFDDYFKEHRFEVFKTKADLSKLLYLEKDVEFPNLSSKTTDGEIVDLSKIKFIVHGTRRSSTVPQKHSKFNKTMISTGSFEDTDGSVLRFKILQEPESKTLHANWVRENK
ncbi:MAG: restriction endonuclease [Deltaproteobacteria bacterium]|jgi:hypothetical protein|nr:restriction endonuclease [Deltaproteobacteria bacterium]